MNHAEPGDPPKFLCQCITRRRQSGTGVHRRYAREFQQRTRLGINGRYARDPEKASPTLRHSSLMVLAAKAKTETFKPINQDLQNLDSWAVPLAGAENCFSRVALLSRVDEERRSWSLVRRHASKRATA
nr:hypothetical protein CFP56_03048 [Quercus suber]